MGRTACTEPQCLYKGALYLYLSVGAELFRADERTDRHDEADSCFSQFCERARKRGSMHTDRCGNTREKKCRAKGSGKEIKVQEFVYRDTTNVDPDMYDYTGNNWSHRNGNKRFKEKFGSHTRKTFSRYTTKTAVLGTSHIMRKVLQCEA